MRTLGIAEILETAAKQNTRDEKIAFLQHHKNSGLTTILQMLFHQRDCNMALPSGAPPYTPSKFPYQEQNLYKEIRKFYVFFKESAPNVTQMKREKMFKETLEMLDPKDAELLVAVKDHKMPWDGLTPVLINDAFPNLIDLTQAIKVDNIPANLGRKFTEEHKEALRQTHIKNKAAGVNLGGRPVGAKTKNKTKTKMITLPSKKKKSDDSLSISSSDMSAMPIVTDVSSCM